MQSPESMLISVLSVAIEDYVGICGHAEAGDCVVTEGHEDVSGLML